MQKLLDGISMRILLKMIQCMFYEKPIIVYFYCESSFRYFHSKKRQNCKPVMKECIFMLYNAIQKHRFCCSPVFRRFLFFGCCFFLYFNSMLCFFFRFFLLLHNNRRHQFSCPPKDHFIFYVFFYTPLLPSWLLPDSLPSYVFCWVFSLPFSFQKNPSLSFDKDARHESLSYYSEHHLFSFEFKL